MTWRELAFRILQCYPNLDEEATVHVYYRDRDNVVLSKKSAPVSSVMMGGISVESSQQTETWKG